MNALVQFKRTTSPIAIALLLLLPDLSLKTAVESAGIRGVDRGLTKVEKRTASLGPTGSGA